MNLTHDGSIGGNLAPVLLPHLLSCLSHVPNLNHGQLANLCLVIWSPKGVSFFFLTGKKPGAFRVGSGSYVLLECE